MDPVRAPRGTLAGAFGAVALLLGPSAPARAADPAGALEELKRGYALKQAGNCRDALPHFERSQALEPTPKALLNESDCEQRLGDLVAAREHATLGQRLARDQGDSELAGVAADQLAAIEPRVAWLTVKLGAGAPADTAIQEDDRALPVASLGAPHPVNPGVHTVTVSAPHHQPRTYPVALGEGQGAALEVVPDAEDAPSIAYTAGWIAALGIGVAGLSVGIGAGIAAGAKHGALTSACVPDGVCPESARGDLDAFHSLRTWSTIGYVVGAAGMAGAGLVWWLAPRRSDRGSARVIWGPTSVTLTGRF